MAASYTYYVNGLEVTEAQARRYFELGARRSATRGYCDAREIPALWARRTTEQGREVIFDLSASSDQGGLEIVKED